MNHLARTVTVASTLSLLLLSNCSSFDPTDIMDSMFQSQKKPLPGDRRPLFPSGTPGVSSGLPPELMKGYQPPPPDATQDAQAAPERPKPKAKPKPKVADAPPPPANRSSAPTAATQAPAPTRTAPSQSSPWPDPQPSRQSAAPGGGTAWPDPPAPVTR
jgi:hypothetical protein